MISSYGAYMQVFAAILVLSCVIPVLLTLFRKRVVNRHVRLKDRTINSTVFSFFASLYAFFLGFSMVTLWTAFQNTRAEVSMEAAGVLNVYRLSAVLPGSQPLRQALGDYATSVVDVEWPRMDQTDQMHPETQEKWHKVWQEMIKLKPADKADNNLYTNLADSLTKTTGHRLSRALLLSGNLYPPVWVLICFGAGALLIGLVFTNTQQELPQILFEGVIVFFVFSCIFFIYDISTPFSGVLKVEPDAFADVLKAMHIYPVTP